MTTLANQQSIVVGIDGSTTALAAARWAGVLAARQRVPLVVLGVVPLVDYRIAASAWAELDILPSLRAAAERNVAAAAAAVRQDQPELEIRPLVVDGDAAHALVQASAAARLLVVAATPGNRLTTLLLGSTALRVANKATCPVAVWRGDIEHPLPDRRPVLVGVDGSPDGEDALAHTFETASLLGVDIVALHAWEDPDLLRWTVLPESWPDLATQEQELLAERLAGWQPRPQSGRGPARRVDQPEPAAPRPVPGHRLQAAGVNPERIAAQGK
ncbi:universal stress protein [Nocardia arthritidis]|uniref:Universal stress protein n=1 Tax=Nocardia arthritidis TaxID=228602 RepID=A0A6G9YJC7_9NOCA|nr:universal stress protein [Nocardia arthritidis]QIS13359.1 universal stress protein [Nocardia arthritidis]